MGQCLDGNKTVDSFLIFDTPKEGEDLWLELGDTEIRLGELSTLMQATPIPVVLLPTPTTTNTPPIPIPEKPQCKRQLNLFDFSSDSLEVVDNILGNTGCVEYFALYEPQPSRFLVDTGIVISANESREQVLQTVYDINKQLFTSKLGITCIRIFVYPPYNRTIPGVNQALSYELAQEFNGRWDTASAQEWWSWLEANRTPSEQISENCEMNHWAQWDNRIEVAPWK